MGRRRTTTAFSLHTHPLVRSRFAPPRAYSPPPVTQRCGPQITSNRANDAGSSGVTTLAVNLEAAAKPCAASIFVPPLRLEAVGCLVIIAGEPITPKRTGCGVFAARWPAALTGLAAAPQRRLPWVQLTPHTVLESYSPFLATHRPTFLATPQSLRSAINRSPIYFLSPLSLPVFSKW